MFSEQGGRKYIEQYQQQEGRLEARRGIAMLRNRTASSIRPISFRSMYGFEQVDNKSLRADAKIAPAI